MSHIKVGNGLRVWSLALIALMSGCPNIAPQDQEATSDPVRCLKERVNHDGRSFNLSGCIINQAQANFSRDDLSNSNLSNAILEGANFSFSILRKANLRKASLSSSNLSHANLSQANLKDADLHKATLWYASLSGADLTGTDLTNASLWNANLSGADLTGATLLKAQLIGADLNGVKWSNTICPDGENSDSKDSKSCKN